MYSIIITTVPVYIKFCSRSFCSFIISLIRSYDKPCSYANLGVGREKRSELWQPDIRVRNVTHIGMNM